jgi:outer membrane protein assembly factor BamB
MHDDGQLRRAPMRRPLQILLVVAGLALGVGVGAPTGALAAADESTAFQVTPGHTGFASGGSLERPPLRPRWTRNLGTSTSYPLVAGRRVFVIAYDAQHATGTLFALDTVTGATLWSRSTDGSGQIAYDRGRVFLAESSGPVLALAADTGVTEWIRTLPQPFQLQAPVAAGGVVYVDSAWSGGGLWALNGDDGSTAWFTSFWDEGSPGVDGTFVYVSDDYEGATAAFSRADGSIAWQGSAQCFVGSGHVVTDGARVIGPFNSNCGAVVDAATGDRLDSFSASAAPAAAGDVAVVLNGTTLEARSLATGLLLWEFAGDGGLRSAPVIVNQTVYAGSSTGTVFAVDLRTGVQSWSGQVADDGSVAGAPGMAVGDGLLVVPAGGSLIGLESAQAPRPGLDLRITAGPDGPTSLTSAALSFGASDPAAPETCRLDAGAWSPCRGTSTFTLLAAGPHMFEVETHDPADGSPVALAVRGWSVGAKVPGPTPVTSPGVTLLTAAPPALTASAGATFAFAASVPASFECRLDGSAWTPCSSPDTLAGLADGTHVFDVRAIDSADGVGLAPVSSSWTVDTRAPATAVSLDPASGSRFTLTADESPVTFECRVDGGGWIPCASGVAYPGLPAGAHEFVARAIDAAGNRDPTGAILAFTVPAPVVVAPLAGPELTGTQPAVAGPSPNRAASTALPTLDAPTLARTLAGAGARLLATSTRRQLRTAAVVKLFASGPAGVALAVRAGVGAHAYAFAAGRLTFAHAGTRSVRLRLTPAGLQALARPGRLSVQVRATVAPVHGPAASASASTRV